eukprot:TRINITY_DN12001_c0_g1_i1.p1 TRINITY_DN12001_c0_g1~~TRINITY_DN12001_c0_g1_i1.p1  ORF type:complete len:227 (-),score=46.31 TRINITY_DN12001_c0_g1_i1:17-697(-)
MSTIEHDSEVTYWDIHKKTILSVLGGVSLVAVGGYLVYKAMTSDVLDYFEEEFYVNSFRKFSSNLKPVTIEVFRRELHKNDQVIEVRRNIHKDSQDVYDIEPNHFIDIIIHIADTNNDGMISCEEYVDACKALRKFALGDATHLEKLAFTTTDTDRSEGISRSELKALLHKLYPYLENIKGREKIDGIVEKIFKNYDKDKNGVITYEEWIDIHLFSRQFNTNTTNQ